MRIAPTSEGLSRETSSANLRPSAEPARGFLSAPPRGVHGRGGGGHLGRHHRVHARLREGGRELEEEKDEDDVREWDDGTFDEGASARAERSNRARVRFVSVRRMDVTRSNARSEYAVADATRRTFFPAGLPFKLAHVVVLTCRRARARARAPGRRARPRRSSPSPAGKCGRCASTALRKSALSTGRIRARALIGRGSLSANAYATKTYYARAYSKLFLSSSSPSRARPPPLLFVTTSSPPRSRPRPSRSRVTS